MLRHETQEHSVVEVCVQEDKSMSAPERICVLMLLATRVGSKTVAFGGNPAGRPMLAGQERVREKYTVGVWWAF